MPESADDDRRLTLFDLQVDVIQDPLLAEGLTNLTKLNDRVRSVHAAEILYISERKPYQAMYKPFIRKLRKKSSTKMAMKLLTKASVQA